MAEPGLQLEQGHGLLGVVELAGDGRARPMARDATARVVSGHARLATEGGDERLIEIVACDPLGAQADEQRHGLARASIEQQRLSGTDSLPRVDRLADERIDGLGERGAGFVGRHVEQADAVGAIGARLPADAPDPQPDDLIAAQAPKQPRHGQGPDEFDGVAIAGVAACHEICVGEVEPRPQEFRPEIIGDHARDRADQGLDGPRRGQGTCWIKAPRHPAPFLAIPKERVFADHSGSFSALRVNG